MPSDAGDASGIAANADSDVSRNNEADDSSEASPGHGRLGADDYPGADQVDVSHPELSPGDACPECVQGTLYEKSPGVLVRFIGQAPLHATVYRMQKLRCHLCGKLFTAPSPAGIGDDKFDHTVASMIGLLKYGNGMPFNRLQGLQGSCEIPLAASTQWDIVHAASLLIAPAYNELIRQAAQGEVLYNDDTTVRILEMMGQRCQKNTATERRSAIPAVPACLPQALLPRGQVCASRCSSVALGMRAKICRDVLQHRAAQLESPVQMCDGLRGICPKDSTRSWQTAWRTAVATSWNFTIGFPKNVDT